MQSPLSAWKLTFAERDIWRQLSEKDKANDEGRIRDAATSTKDAERALDDDERRMMMSAANLSPRAILKDEDDESRWKW